MDDLVMQPLEKACELAQDAGEAFVLSVISAYVAGKQAGREEALSQQAS